MTPSLESKLPDVGTTIFTVMSQLAAEHGAINLSQGFPDFDGPAALLDRVNQYLHGGHNQYAPMTGVPALRQAVAAKLAECYGANVDADSEVTIVPGATAGLFCAISALVRPGDEVVLFDPAYDSYAPVVRLNGGTTRHVPLLAPEFGVDWDHVAEVMGPRTRLVVVNTPHNPTGTVWRDDDMARLQALCEEHDAFVLADEVYEHIIFDGVQHASVLRWPELYARSIMVSSFGKTYHATGWKIGYVVAPPALSAELRKLHQYVTFTTNTPTQLALADFLRDCPEHHRELPAFYEAKRDLFCSLIADSRFHFMPSAGTYFQLVEYSAISDEDDVTLARRLTTEHGVAAIPVSVFYAEPPQHQRVLRFCFAKDDATLRQAAEVLCRL